MGTTRRNLRVAAAVWLAAAGALAVAGGASTAASSGASVDAVVAEADWRLRSARPRRRS